MNNTSGNNGNPKKQIGTFIPFQNTIAPVFLVFLLMPGVRCEAVPPPDHLGMSNSTILIRERVIRTIPGYDEILKTGQIDSNKTRGQLPDLNSVNKKTHIPNNKHLKKRKKRKNLGLKILAVAVIIAIPVSIAVYQIDHVGDHLGMK